MALCHCLGFPYFNCYDRNDVCIFYTCVFYDGRRFLMLSSVAFADICAAVCLESVLLEAFYLCQCHLFNSRRCIVVKHVRHGSHCKTEVRETSIVVFWRAEPTSVSRFRSQFAAGSHTDSITASRKAPISRTCIQVSRKVD